VFQVGYLQELITIFTNCSHWTCDE